MIVIESLGDYLQSNLALRAYCAASCGHDAKVDIQQLANKFGEQALLCDLVPKMRCSRCGSGARIIQSHQGGATIDYIKEAGMLKKAFS